MKRLAGLVFLGWCWMLLCGSAQAQQAVFSYAYILQTEVNPFVAGSNYAIQKAIDISDTFVPQMKRAKITPETLPRFALMYLAMQCELAAQKSAIIRVAQNPCSATYISLFMFEGSLKKNPGRALRLVTFRADGKECMVADLESGRTINLSGFDLRRVQQDIRHPR